MKKYEKISEGNKKYEKISEANKKYSKIIINSIKNYYV